MPFPYLKIETGVTINGKVLTQIIPLIGYGKFGAAGSLGKIEKKIGNSQDIVKTQQKIRTQVHK